MPRKSLTAAEAAAWATLAYAAKINLSKQSIARGSYRVDLRVSGTVAGYPVDLTIAGEGTQSGPQTTASSSGPSQDELWAYARTRMAQSRIDEIEQEAVALWAAEERLPGVDEEAAKACKPFLKQCRAATSTTKAGSYTFAADPDPNDLAAAQLRDAA